MIPIARFPIATAVAALAVIVLGLSRAAAAADDLKSLQDALSNVNQEQQAIFQQFQMIQALRRRDADAARIPPVGTVGSQVGPPRNYDDVVAAQKAQAERDDRYSRQLDELYSRHRDLDRERQSIMEGMQKLRQVPRPAGG